MNNKGVSASIIRAVREGAVTVMDVADVCGYDAGRVSATLWKLANRGVVERCGHMPKRYGVGGRKEVMYRVARDRSLPPNTRINPSPEGASG